MNDNDSKNLETLYEEYTASMFNTHKALQKKPSNLDIKSAWWNFLDNVKNRERPINTNIYKIVKTEIDEMFARSGHILAKIGVFNSDDYSLHIVPNRETPNTYIIRLWFRGKIVGNCIYTKEYLEKFLKSITKDTEAIGKIMELLTTYPFSATKIALDKKGKMERYRLQKKAMNMDVDYF